MTVAASQDLEKTKKTIIKVLTTCEEESAEDERHGVALFVKPKKTDPRKHDRPTSKTDSIEGGAGAARRAPRRGIKPTGHGTRLQRALPPEGEEQLRDGNHWTKNRPNKTSTGKANRVRQGSTSRQSRQARRPVSRQATDEPFVQEDDIDDADANDSGREQVRRTHQGGRRGWRVGGGCRISISVSP